MQRLLDVSASVTEFIFTYVVVKMIVAHWLYEQIMKLYKKFTSGRHVVIWNHHKQGHTAASIFECNDGNCATI